MTKVCKNCNETKPLTEYYKRSAAKDGLMYQCKMCKKSENAARRQTDKGKQYESEYSGRPDVKARAKQWKEMNKDSVAKSHTRYRQNNKESIMERNKQYRQENKDVVAEIQRQYRQRNKEAIRENQKRYIKERRANDTAFRTALNLRARMSDALNGRCKADTTKALLGCTYEEACAYIEAQFTEGMSWDKMGIHGIHIDHIRPCASFDLTDPEQQRECFHYTNLQPLWAEDNLKKGASNK